jgi:hypothetical protein
MNDLIVVSAFCIAWYYTNDLACQLAYTVLAEIKVNFEILFQGNLSSWKRSNLAAPGILSNTMSYLIVMSAFLIA